MSWLERVLGGARGAQDAPPHGDPERVAAAREVLDELRPLVAADGGHIELVSVEGGWVSVRLRGACAHCHASDMTLRGALEPRLRARLPWFVGLRAL